MIKVLLVEDETSLAEIVKDSLEYKGFNVTLAATEAEAMHTFYKIKPEIIILDVMLQDGLGFNISKQIRKVNQEVRIIFVTSKSLTTDVIKGFESGGNDYIKKPFQIEELIIRIKVLMSRNQVLINESEDYTEMTIGKFTFSPIQHLLNIGGKNFKLTGKESKLLYLLAINKHQTIDRKTLLNNVWNDDSYFAGRSMDVFITKLRKYLSYDPSIKILNIRGVGYKLIF